jgi:pimeloyl-ACP methyl ester carboxylesterase
MQSDSEFQDFDIYVYEYPTSTFGQCLPITDLANNMRTHLKNGNVFSEHEQVVFLAHSMGGLIARQFLLRNRETVDKVPLVMFFATPTAGSWKANAASLLPTCAQADDLRKLDVNSYLKAQQSDWLSAGLQEKVISHCAFETRSSSGMIVVDRSSATLLCTRDPDALLTDHSDAVKPSGPNDLTHIIVRNALKDLPAPHNSRLDAPQENRELKKQVENLNSRLDQRFKNRTVREQLGNFIREGSAITNLIAQKPLGPLPEVEANEWFARVRKYLLAHLDSSYDARFVSPDPGLPISYDLPTKDHKDLMHGMQIRLTALRRFIEELKD